MAKKILFNTFSPKISRDQILSVGVVCIFGIILLIQILFSKDFRDPMNEFTDLLGEQGILSSTNFDFSPDGQTIVYFNGDINTLVFLDLNGETKSEINLNLFDLELPLGENFRLQHLQWYSEDKLSFIYGSNNIKDPNSIYILELENLTLEPIYSNEYKIYNYCWSNLNDTLFILEHGENLKMLVAQNLDLPQKDSIQIGSSYIACDREKPIAIIGSGKMVEYLKEIKFIGELPTDNNLFLNNFNAENNSFFAVKKLGNKVLQCIGFERYEGNKNFRMSITNHARIPKFVVSKSRQSLLIETEFRNKNRLHILNMDSLIDENYEFPDLTRNGCGSDY